MYQRIDGFHAEMMEWRHHIHRHPETAFEEVETAAFVAEKLESFGVEVHRGLAGTGVVGTLQQGRSNKAIALRADMDALDIHEANDFDYRSKIDGKMHACGHDGHTTMLLGAARYLAEARHFDGIVQFIFQPAEENEGGARVMIEEGLFKQFPVDAVYGMHNMPQLPAGTFAIRTGPQMAACDTFEMEITGTGTHAAMPHKGIDPVVVASHIVIALQAIVSRTIDPLQSVVISVTQFHAGDTWNVIPETAILRASVRSFEPEMRSWLAETIERCAQGVCASYGAQMRYDYRLGYPATVNPPHETKIAAAVAGRLVGAENVNTEIAPVMGSEDFAFMLQEKPGAYILIGNGAAGGPGGCIIHNPAYDFNDEILPLGAKYWAHLAESELPVKTE